MDQGTKQRVVGTVVLLALALIFLPVILDGDGNYQPIIGSRIPAAPEVQIMPTPVPQRPVIEADRFESPSPEPVPPAEEAPGENSASVSVTDGLESEPEPVAEPESVPDTTSVTVSLDERSLPEGWSVRLGLFSNRENASNLRQRLLDAGYRAYSREYSGADGVMTGVFVGPQIDRAEANRLKNRLQEEYQLAGLVVRFEVDSI